MTALLSALLAPVLVPALVLGTVEIIAIVAAVVLVAAIIGVVVVRSRSGRELPPAADKPELEKPELETPEAEEPTAPAPPAAGDAESVTEHEAPTEPEAEAEEEPEQPAAVETETPESVPSRMQRLRSRLANSGAMGKAILSILSRGDLSASDWEEIEDELLMADLGLEATEQLMDALKTETKVAGTTDSSKVREILRAKLLELVGTDMDRSLNLEKPTGTDGAELPACVLVVGVNGTGKTTTVGKMARLLVAEDKTVVLGAADTFRAAAAEQLQTWGDRVGVDVVKSDREGADPASVAFDAVGEGISRDADVVLVDTAGRLQTKSTLMDELGKVKRVMEKSAPVGEVLLVLDATTGQNGMRQAEVFAEVVDVTGIVLTKLDGSAKGGIVVSVQKELGVPVKLVGLGEGPDDLAPFDPESFVDAIVSA